MGDGSPRDLVQTGDRLLVCVTTCRRLERLRAYLPPLAAFAASESELDLLVSLDGNEADYLEFCDRWTVPLLWSEEREGVGFSKNRVLTRFPDYDFYVFLDDDVELVDGRVFREHVEAHRETGIHHFSLFEGGRPRRPRGSTPLSRGRQVLHGLFGGGQFNFFTAEGLHRVGGWHPLFARYRRWGHTEHSYRFLRAGLAPAPFNAIPALEDRCIWHYPEAVTADASVAVTEDDITEMEQELIDEELQHVPLTTGAPFHFNEVPWEGVRKLGERWSPDDLYPLLSTEDRRRKQAEREAWKALRADGFVRRWLHLGRAAVQAPGSPAVRHAVKRSLGLVPS